MSPEREPDRELQTLLAALFDGEMTAEQETRLGGLLRDHPHNQNAYLDCCWIHGLLRRGLGDCPDFRVSENGTVPFGPRSDLRTVTPGERQPEMGMPLSPSRASEPPVPVFGFLSTALDGTIGYFSSGWTLAYLLTTVLFGAGWLIGSHIYVSDPEQLARQSNLLPSPASGRGAGGEGGEFRSSLPSIVGRITGMVDCKWEKERPGVRGQESGADNQKSEIINHKSRVSLGQKFALASGLMEITYNTGAKVVLQGPTTFEADSNGGYLTVGKLTGKLEKKVGSGQWAVGSKSTINNQQSTISNPQSLIPNPFVIRTPTATVTDLGTEFGVEVDRSGATQSRVFCGKVKVAVLNAADGNPDGQPTEGREVVLGENESVLVEKPATGGPRLVVHRGDATPVGFVRELADPAGLLPDRMIASENLVLWLKADAIRGVRDGTPIRVWSDSSGNRNHMYQDVDAHKPVYVAGANSGLNNMPVVRFRGKECFSGLTPVRVMPSGAVQGLATPFMLFCVVKNADIGDNEVIRGYFGGGARCLAFGMGRHRTEKPRNPGWINIHPKNSFWVWTPYELCNYGQADSIDANWNVHAYAIPDLTVSHWSWYCNGRALGTAGTSSGTPQQYEQTIYVGTSGTDNEYWVGDIAELLIFDRELAQPERDRVGGYLAQKYQISTAWAASAPNRHVENHRNPKPREDVPMNAR